MRLVITRSALPNQPTIGLLAVDGKRECFTLEDPVRPDGVKVFGETAIPAGIYNVEITFSPRFRRMLPLLVNVKGFVGIRIHPGNTEHDTEGCILVGQSLGPNRTILNSRAAFEPLFAKLAGARSRDEVIQLAILST